MKDASKQRDDRERRKREDEIDEKIVSEAGVVQSGGGKGRGKEQERRNMDDRWSTV